MKKTSILLPLIIALLFFAGCTPSIKDMGLPYAKPYQVVMTHEEIIEEAGDRTIGRWSIMADEASDFEEFAQTAIQAVRDLYQRYHKDYTRVALVPSDKLRQGVVLHASASYAADGKGALGLTGSAPATEGYWKVRAADRQITEQEAAIAELWVEKIDDFPNPDPLSSCSYDAEALRQYIADTLQIPYSEAQLPYLQMTEYEVDDEPM